MNYQQQRNLMYGGVAFATVIGLGWIVSVTMAAAHRDSDRYAALHAYALKTSGHVEKYKTGSHIESRYAGSVPTNDGKGGTTSIYSPVEVEDYDYRIVYFDNRAPYYPEDHDDWRAELERIQALHKCKK